MDLGGGVLIAIQNQIYSDMMKYSLEIAVRNEISFDMIERVLNIYV